MNRPRTITPGAMIGATRRTNRWTRGAIACFSRSFIDLSAVEHLLAERADRNILDALRMSPLVWAVYGGHVEIVEALCAGGADVDFWVNTGETALWHAEDDFGLSEVAAVLRRYGTTAK
jgi:ankyrin repeat protein